MRYTVFGRTGHTVSSLGFGAMNLPGVPFEQARDALNYALDRGITYIDTAAAYRNSEEIIGDSISHRRNEYFLATKTGQREYDKAKEEIERSLKRMKTDYIDLLQIHYVNTVQEFKKAMGENGAYQAALEAKLEGKVRFIGITGHRPDLLAKWIEPGLFDQVLFHLSLVQPFALEELIPTATRLDMGKVAMKPLSGGFVQPVEKALRYTHSHDIHTMISGMISVEQVKENLEALEREIDEEEKRELDALAADLSTHNCRRCNYCSCPIEIAIPDVMISSVVSKQLGLLPKGNAFFEKQRDKLKACAEHEPCKEKPLCESKCPYHLPMQRTMQEAAARLA
ncbi:MAG TPA: aldo/keto reductase [Paenibacillus sp.]|nr:aldo/keto reductase [Paenibacillus sp.]